MVRLRQAAVILGAAVCAALISNLVASPTRRLPWVGRYPGALTVPVRGGDPTHAARQPTPASPAGSLPAGEYPAHPERPWVDITNEQAVTLHGRGIPFLDARRTAVYAEGHVAGARSFPIWEAAVVDEAIKKLFEEGHDVNAPLVIYCSGGDCEDSHMLAERLHGYGFNNALVYTGGFPDWQKRGLRIEKGSPE